MLNDFRGPLSLEGGQGAPHTNQEHGLRLKGIFRVSIGRAQNAEARVLVPIDVVDCKVRETVQNAQLDLGVLKSVRDRRCAPSNGVELSVELRRQPPSCRTLQA